LSVISATLSATGNITTATTGAVGVGTSTLTGYGLRVEKSITGGTTAYSIYGGGTIQSDVKPVNQIQSIQLLLMHLLCLIFVITLLEGTFGAGSIVTIQSGLLVENNLIGVQLWSSQWQNLVSLLGITTTGTISSISSSGTTVTVNHDAITYTDGQTVNDLCYCKCNRFNFRCNLVR
jgi:hypothetical protein